MGEVYLARDTRLGRRVAIKILPSEYADDAQRRARLRREAKAIGSLNHPHICTLYDIGEFSGGLYLVMECVEGETLAKKLRKGALPFAQVLHYGIQIAGALNKAHRKRILHRDLKPSNVAITSSGAKLLDFGLAKFFLGTVSAPLMQETEISSQGVEPLDHSTESITDQKPLTADGATMGTLEYMSPEQLQGTEPDARSDIFSFGVCLYQMATGKHPFPGNNRAMIIAAILEHEPLPVSSYQPLSPPAFDWLVRMCLIKDRSERIQSAHDIMLELKRIARIDSTISSEEHAAAQDRPRRNFKLSRVFAIIAAILVIGGIVGGWVRMREPKRSAPQAPHHPVSILIADFDNRTGDPIFDRTLEPVLTLDLEGAPFINSFSRVQARKVAAQIQPNAVNLDERIARLVAIREGLNAVVSGAIDDGNAYRLTLRALEAVTGNPISVSVVSAKTKEQVLSAVGHAAADLRRALGDTTPASKQLAAAETFTAGSLEAAHQYR